MYNEKESTEDYLEKIFILRENSSFLRAIDLAKSMHFSKASVSVALHKLKDKGYVEINESDGNITLTKSGEALAKETYSKHLLLTSMFEGLGVDKETAETDACKIEHLLSDKTYEALIKHSNKQK